MHKISRRSKGIEFTGKSGVQYGCTFKIFLCVCYIIVSCESPVVNRVLAQHTSEYLSLHTVHISRHGRGLLAYFTRVIISTSGCATLVMDVYILFSVYRIE